MERFQQERASMHKRIEEQVQLVQAMGTEAERLRSGIRSLDLNLTASSLLDLSMPGSAPSAQTDLSAQLRAAPAASRMNWRVLTVGSGLLLGGAVLLGAMASRGTQPVGTQSVATVSSSAPTATVSQANAPAPALHLDEATIKLAINVLPSDATVTLDGAPLPRLPFEGTFRRARGLHHLEVRAAGYQTVKQLIAFDLDRELSMVLRPLPASPKERAKRPSSAAVEVAPPAPTATPPAVQPVDMGGEEAVPGVELKTRPRRPNFELNDPYAN
jgi:hypothetical protein